MAADPMIDDDDAVARAIACTVEDPEPLLVPERENRTRYAAAVYVGWRVCVSTRSSRPVP